MSNFHKIKLPRFLAVKAIGSPIFATNIALTASGREVRSADRMSARQKYTISSCRLSAQQFDEFNCFFRARLGMQFSFLMRDYGDFSLQGQVIGENIAEQSVFEVFKTYEDPINSYKRRIKKLVEGSVQLNLNDLEFRGANIDYDRGAVILPHPLLIDQRLTINTFFDVEVRFASDNFKYSLDSCGSVIIDDLEILEVL